MEGPKLEKFERVSDQPLLGVEAVPWCAPKKVMKGANMPEAASEVRRTIMHPSAIDLKKWTSDAPARFAMYYAPHHSEGIGMATARSLAGPWTPLSENPIVELNSFSGFKGHISAPDVIFLPEEQRFRMYFHGGTHGAGQQTGLATSQDGIHFAVYSQDPILKYPYLRLFRRDSVFYGVVRVGNDLGLVRSDDGITWEDWPRGLLLCTGDQQQEYDRLRHHAVWIVGDRLYLYYCTYTKPDLSVEAIKLATMDISGDWSDWPMPTRRGVALGPELDWERGNIRDPYLIEADGGLFMFYVGGNEIGIALARMTR